MFIRNYAYINCHIDTNTQFNERNYCQSNNINYLINICIRLYIFVENHVYF